MMHLHLKSKIVHSTLLATLLIISGCSSSDGKSDSGDNTAPPASLASGPVVDGYIAGGHLYADLDASASENAGDVSTTTDVQGNFTFGETEIPHGTYLYVSGGTDLATNTPFTGELSAYFVGDTTVISPLSTVTASLIKNEDLTYEEAKTRTAQMMGLTEDQVVSDPFAEPVDTEVFIATQRIVSVAETLGGDFSTAVDALASADMDITAAAGTLGVDPSEAIAVDTYMTELEAQMPDDATPEDLSAYQTIITEVISDPANIPSATASADVANALACVTFDAIKGTNTAENNITTDLVLDSCENADDNVSFVWNSDNTLLLDDTGSIITPVYTGGAVNLSVTVTSDDTTVSAQKSFALTVPRLDNHAPVAVADSMTTNEDTPASLNVLANDSDADGDTLTLVAVSNGVNFTADGVVNYTPVQDFSGDFQFAYTVRDSWGDEVNSSVTITVTPVNDAPVLDNIADLTLDEDFLPYTLEINASDVEGDLLTYSVVSVDPTIVNASFNANQLDLISVSDLNGDTNITVMVSDGDKSDTQTFTLHVLAVDDAPSLDPIATPAPIDEDSGDLRISYTAEDIDSNLNVTAESNNTNIATATIMHINGIGYVVITPQPDQSGVVQVTVTADDGVNPAVTRSFDVTITAVDDAPVLSPVADITMAEDSSAGTITLSATDIDNDDTAITYAVADYNSSLINASTFGHDLTVSGISDAFGETDMNVSAVSGGQTVYQIVHVTVTPVDDAPVLAPMSNVTVLEDNGTISVSPSATDVDNDDAQITYSYMSSDPSIVTGGTALATVIDANGMVTITVTALSNGLTDTTDFNITVTAVNDAPTADSFLLPVVTGATGVQIDLAAHIDDIDGDALTVTVFDTLDGLALNPDQRSFTFDSNGTEGSFVVNYTVSDPDGLTATASMTINVSTTPIYPQANALTATTQEEVPVSIDLLTPNLNATSIVSATAGSGSAIIEANGTITFTPVVDFSGTAVISYTVASDTADQNSSTVTVTVTDVNDAPVIGYITTVPVNETESSTDQIIHVDFNITDVDTDLSSVTITGGVSSNPDIFVVNAGTYFIELSVPAYVNGDTNVTVTFSDGEDSAVSTFEIHVMAVNSPALFGVRTFAVDGTAGPQTYSLDVQPSNESYTLSITDTGDANVATFSISGTDLTIDPQGTGDTTITVEAVNDADNTLVTSQDIQIHVYDPSNVAPVSEDAEFSVIVDEVLAEPLSATDANGDMLTYIIVTPPSEGTLNPITNWGAMTYIATDGYIGDVTFTYKVNDGALDSNVSTVTIHVTTSPEAGQDGDDDLTEAEFNALSSTVFPESMMYGIDEDGWDTHSELDMWNVQVDHSTQYLRYANPSNNERGVIPFTYDTDNNTLLLDFPNDSNQTDGVADEKLRLVSTLTDAALSTELNMTLPTGVVGYKIASLTLNEEYEIWTDGDPEYQDWDCSVPNEPCVGSNPYSDLDSFMADRSYDPNSMATNDIWIDGYKFKFAQDSNLSAGVDVAQGTIVRTARYYDQDLGQDVETVTNTDAGTWVYMTTPDGDEVIKITPSVYGLSEVRLFARATANDTDYYVYGGDYTPANQGDIEYWYDENTMYHVGNSIMNRTVNLPSRALTDARGEFASFNSLATEPLVTGSWMHAIWAYDDNGAYSINMHSLKFDDNATAEANATLEMRDTQDGDNNLTYTVNGNVATIVGTSIDAKVVETITDATRLSQELGLPDTVFATYHTAYLFAHVEGDAELDVWSSDMIGNDGTTTYPDYTSFETAFMNHEVVLDSTPNNTVIIYGSGSAGVGGSLIEYDLNTQSVVDLDAGTWSVTTYNGEQIMLINIDVERFDDHNAIALGSSGNMSRAKYRPADSGSVEYRFDDNTANAIITYLEDQNQSYDNKIQFEKEFKILRELEVVTFPNTKMNRVDFDIDQTTCERSVERTYDWLNGDSSSGDFDISNYPHDFTYTSSDGLIATVSDSTGDVFKVKVNEDLNATQLINETGLFLPMSAHGYRTTYMDLATGEGRQKVRLDDATVEYLESYYNNNHMLDSMCGVPAP